MVFYLVHRAFPLIELRLRADHSHLGRNGEDINKMTLGGLGHLFYVRLE